jgi:predicted dithiol-disulfide oxidoreductase (DUF899 family)
MDGANFHLSHHDVTLLAASRGKLADIQAYKKRMGWKVEFVSSFGSDFNFDYHVSFHKGAEGQDYNYAPTNGGSEELPGLSVFYKDAAGDIFHTYSSYARGGDILIGTNNYLDLTPKGRNETQIMDWMRRHDEYADAKSMDDCCHS